MKTSTRSPSGPGPTSLPTRKRPSSRPPPPAPARKAPSPDQLENQRGFGDCSTLWTTHLTDPERQAWNRTASRLPRPRRLTRTGRRAPRITGQRLFVKVNAIRLAFGLELLRLPPHPRFRSNPVGQFSITWLGGRLALQLALSTAPAGPILLYASAPCSPGVSVCPKFRRLGLLPEPLDGLSDFTPLYRSHFGLPPAGRRLFVRTRYLDNYLSTFFRTANALVPAPPVRNGHSPRPPSH